MPYRIELIRAPEHAVDALIDLGALDVDAAGGRIEAVIPDAVTVSVLATSLGVGEADLRISPAVGRDDDSVWALRLAPVRGLRLVDSTAFGTGLHATTTLCLDAIEDALETATPPRMLDVGTGSGILALAALNRGVGLALGVDTDGGSLRAAVENARLNGVGDRFYAVHGGPHAIGGSWPLVAANIRAAELVEMAPLLVRRLASGARLILSGIPRSAAAEVEEAYRRLGMARARVSERDGWIALALRPSW